MFERFEKLDDSELVARSRERDDPRAMHELYRRHAGRVYAMALRFTRHPADAEDVVQEAFLRAWRNLDTFRGEAAFGTWLYRIGVNLCRDHARRTRPMEPEVDGSTDQRPADVMTRKRLEAALSGLSEGYREVLVLHDVLELNHAEIAEILGVEVGTCKSQLHKARARMRSLLSGK